MIRPSTGLPLYYKSNSTNSRANVFGKAMAKHVIYMLVVLFLTVAIPSGLRYERVTAWVVQRPRNVFANFSANF